MNQNISQPTTSDNQLPASLQPIPVSRGQIQSLVSWIARDGKVSYLTASMVVETPVINAAIKLGLIALEETFLVLAGLAEQVVHHTKTHLEQASKQVSADGFFEALPATTNQEVLAAIFGEAFKLTLLTSQEKALIITNTRNKHAQIANQITTDLVELEEKNKQTQEKPRLFQT